MRHLEWLPQQWQYRLRPSLVRREPLSSQLMDQSVARVLGDRPLHSGEAAFKPPSLAPWLDLQKLEGRAAHDVNPRINRSASALISSQCSLSNRTASPALSVSAETSRSSSTDMKAVY